MCSAQRGERLALSVEELGAFMATHFPVAVPWVGYVEALEPGRVVMRLPFSDEHLRPGGTISGPSLMTLVDTAVYFLILAHRGPVGLAVTSSLHIDFLRKPRPADVVATATFLKDGRRLVVGRVEMVQDGDPRPVAHATATYAMPDDAGEGP
ncbi:MAG: PaaI family thioesterase [Deltaproteobacteria bacterium]|nr:PaaI family thioesterase [Deltaproteobacteria bacterium]